MILKRKVKIIKTVFSFLTVLVLFCSFTLNIYAADPPLMYSMGGSIYDENHSKIYTGNVDYVFTFSSDDARVDYSFIINPSISKAATLDQIDSAFSYNVFFDDGGSYAHAVYVNGHYFNFWASDNLFTSDVGYPNNTIPPDGSFFACNYDFDLNYDSISYEPTTMQIEARDFYLYLDPNHELVSPNDDYDDVFSESSLYIDVNDAYNGAEGVICYVEAGYEDTSYNNNYYYYSLSPTDTNLLGPYSQFPVLPMDQSLDGAYSEPTLIYVKYLSFSVPIVDFDLPYITGTYISYNMDYRNIDISAVDPESIDPMVFRDYTSWLGTAVGGFLDLQLVEGFTFGGILMVLIGFMISLWFLKVFAGG